MQHLSSQTIRLLSSAQVITSVLSAVKELLENALDAGADSIEVKLENFGLDKIEVRDNGSGIDSKDVPLMGQRHYTSKLSDFHDLATVTSYGFRGEALASLCAVAEVSVTTKQACDEVSQVHVLNHNGEVTMTKPSHLGNGTTVTATSMFKTLPVRLQYYNSSASRKKDELRRLTDLMMCYGYVNPGVRLTLSHNRKVVWQKSKVPSCRAALMNTVGANVMNQLAELEQTDDETGVSLHGFLPKRGCDPKLVTRTQNDRCWLYINKRPVTFREAEKLIKQSYSQSLAEGTQVKNIVACLHFTLPTESVDVNLEPDKRKVLLQNKDTVLTILTQAVSEVYAKPKTPPKRRQNKTTSSEEHFQAGVADRLHPSSSDQPTDNIPGCKVNDNRTAVLQADNDTLGMQASEENGPRVNVVASESRTGLATDDDLANSGDSISGQILQARSTDSDEPSFSLFDDELFQDTQVPGRPQSGREHLQNDLESRELSIEGDAGNNPGLDLTSIIRNASEAATMDMQQFFKSGSCGLSTESSESAKDDDTDNVLASARQMSGDPHVQEYLNPEPSGMESIRNDGNVSDWSKGVLLRTRGAPVEPVTLLVPGHTDGRTDTSSFVRECSGADRGSNIEIHEPLRGTSKEPYGHHMEVDLLTGKELPAMRRSEQFQSKQGIPAVCQMLPSSGDVSAMVEGAQQPPPDGTAERIQNSVTGSISASSNISTIMVEAKKTVDDLTGIENQTEQVTKGRAHGGALSHHHPGLLDTPDRTIGCEPGGTLEEYQIPRVSECIAAPKARMVAQGISNGKQSPSKQLMASVKKKPAVPGNQTKRKRTLKKNQLISNQGLIKEMLASQGKRQSTPPVTIKEVPFSTTYLSQFLKDSVSNHDKSDKDTLRLICKLRQLWVVVEGTKVLLFNHFRAEEVVLYHRLLATHVLPAVKLDVPITLNKSMLDTEGPWLTLLGLETSRTSDPGISEYNDRRLLANGFKIRRLVDRENKDLVLQITAIADLIPCYGTADLQEVLRHISDSPVVELKTCRPLKVSNYLKGEAVRIARNKPPTMSMEDTSDLITAVRIISSAPSIVCLHGQPLFTELCSLKE